ncbi:MAG TPA: hypothetical protein PKZ32_03290 [Candidatus Melainabacteria bacterium]|nr:hypothetical protein [Candidatus Melainabacteria bacterium]
MKSLLSIAALGLIATTTLITPAQAQMFAGFGNINQAQARLQQRINAGVRSGKLTRQEAFSLNRKMSRLNAMEAQFRSSGNLSFGERARLNSELSRLSNDISLQLNDFDTRYRNRHHRFRY